MKTSRSCWEAGAREEAPAPRRFGLLRFESLRPCGLESLRPCGLESLRPCGLESLRPCGLARSPFFSAPPCRKPALPRAAIRRKPSLPRAAIRRKDLPRAAAPPFAAVLSSRVPFAHGCAAPLVRRARRRAGLRGLVRGGSAGALGVGMSPRAPTRRRVRGLGEVVQREKGRSDSKRRSPSAAAAPQKGRRAKRRRLPAPRGLLRFESLRPCGLARRDAGRPRFESLRPCGLAWSPFFLGRRSVLFCGAIRLGV